MANTNKMTKVQAFTIALGLVENSTLPNKDEVAGKIAKEIEQLGKKNSATSGKPTAKQIANKELGETVVDFMADHDGEKFTVSELLKAIPNLPDGITAPKLTAILRLDTVKPFVGNVKEKGKSLYFYLSDTDEVE